ncbi:phosphocarrier protein HPr, partial [Oleiphilus sp. HI0009]
MLRETVEIINDLGLHARAAAKFVECTGHFESSFTITKDDREVDGKSIMSVMMLAASKGTQITITVDGADEE